MNTIQYAKTPATVLIAAALFLSPLAADMDTSTVARRFSDEATVAGSSSTLTRSSGGVAATFLTSATPGDAYTLWWVVFNQPENCSGGVCDGDDVLPAPGNTAAGVSVIYASGRVADMVGKTEMGARLDAGDLSHVVFGPGLTDALNAEIHLVLRTHGPAAGDPAMLQEQISSFNGGCPDNGCRDEQFAMHFAADDAMAATVARNHELLQRIARRLSIVAK